MRTTTELRTRDWLVNNLLVYQDGRSTFSGVLRESGVESLPALTAAMEHKLLAWLQHRLDRSDCCNLPRGAGYFLL